MGKRVYTLEGPKEAILPNPPSASSSVDSSATILPHLKELLGSHITAHHHGDDPLNHSYILHQQPSPLDNVVVQPQWHLSECMFIISEATLWYGDTMYENLEIKSI